MLAFRVKKLEMANLVAAVAVMLALRLPWPEVAARSAFALLLNLLVYLNPNRGYEWDRSVKAFQDSLFARVTSWANSFDELRGRKLDPYMPRTGSGIRVL